MDVEEGAQLGEDVVEAPRLAAALAGERVAVHRVAGPHDRVALGLDRPHHRREELGDPLRSQTGDECQTAGEAIGVQPLAQRHDLVGTAVRSDLDADGIVDARHEFEMRAVELPGAVADPDHVGRAVVPVAGEGVDAGQALLVGQDQRLVAGEEVDLVQALLGPEVDAAGSHEAQGAVDLRRDALVALALAGRRHELLVPQVHLGQVGEAALGEGPQEVQRRRRLLVGGHQAPRVGPARLDLEGLVVDHVAPEGLQLHVTDPLGVGRARLGELPGDAPDLDHRHTGRVGQGHRHLQDDLELVPDGVRVEVGEGLGAVARLQEEGLAVGHLRQFRRQVARLAGEDQGWHGGQARLRLLERVRVGPLRLLGGRELAPGRGAPRGGRSGARHRTRLTP